MRGLILIFILGFMVNICFAETCRAVYRDDGGVSIIVPAQKSRNKDESEDKWLNRIFNQSQENDSRLIGRDFEDIDCSTLPSRQDRNSWTGRKGEGVSVDLVKKKKNDDEKLIKDEIEKSKNSKERKDAVDKLKAEGKLPLDFN